jgi:hypothetical protein
MEVDEEENVERGGRVGRGEWKEGKGDADEEDEEENEEVEEEEEEEEEEGKGKSPLLSAASISTSREEMAGEDGGHGTKGATRVRPSSAMLWSRSL